MDPIKSVSEFVNNILARDASSSHVTVYRGHRDFNYNLKPSIFRDQERYENEHLMLRELIAAHPEDFRSDTTALEILVRMQHYTLPTRLLDVSFNPLVALYFACEQAETISMVKKPGAMRGSKTKIFLNGEVIVFRVALSKIKYFDSDTVSCLANLARLNFKLKELIDTSQSKTEFNKSLPIRRLVHFIRQESNGFEADIIPGNLNSIPLIKPKLNNKRILAQAGAFFTFGLNQSLVGGRGLGISISKILIDSTKKSAILKELDKLGINEKTMFPEIERAARYISGGLGTIVPII